MPTELSPLLSLADGGFADGGFDGATSLASLNADARAGVGDNGKSSMTIDQAASNLVGGLPGWSGALGAGFTVSYAYRADEPFRMPDDSGGFERFTETQINEAELALKAWSDVANIRFVRVGFGTTGEGAYSDSATILFGDYTTGVDGAAAFAEFPGSTSSGSSAGDVWVNSTLSYNINPTQGNYGGQVLVHELGHAIGLDHPSDYNATADVTFTYAVDASYYEDSRQYTVMSYFSETNTVTGGAGADLFHGSQDAGIDRVMDFSLAEGDRVLLDPGTTYTLSQMGADTVLDMGGGNQMILVGVPMSSLTPSSIFFG